MRKQHYMTEQERHQLEAMRRNKIPVREIARQLGFCERTIYYELRRGSYTYIVFGDLKSTTNRKVTVHSTASSKSLFCQLCSVGRFSRTR